MQMQKLGCSDPESWWTSKCKRLSMFAYSVVVLMLIDYAIALFLIVIVPRVAKSLTLSRCAVFLGLQVPHLPDMHAYVHSS